eukprot:4001622-Prymnesium_polylepis.1
MARVCGGGDVAGGVPRSHVHPTGITHCAGPGARQAAQAPTAEREACPRAEGARACTPRRAAARERGRPEVAHLCAPA